MDTGLTNYKGITLQGETTITGLEWQSQDHHRRSLKIILPVRIFRHNRNNDDLRHSIVPINWNHIYLGLGQATTIVGIHPFILSSERGQSKIMRVDHCHFASLYQ